MRKIDVAFFDFNNRVCLAVHRCRQLRHCAREAFFDVSAGNFNASRRVVAVHGPGQCHLAEDH
ncbi:hypothetical protein ACFOFO_23615 [Undibacterium arcticum]|uniref:Uncharacterized protein n=1 Tax=Undibacterium arcticum TaxID=1762892 RepID=A0ABV7FAF9_9BURK